MILQITIDERIREVGFYYPVFTKITDIEYVGICKQLTIRP